MRKFIKKIFVFCTPFFIVIVVVEYLYRAQPNNYNVKNYYLNKKLNDIEVLFFGDSHCFYGLNPIYFKSYAFNLSNVSQTIYFDKLLFEQYYKKLPKLKCIILCIEYTNLSQRDNTQDDVFRKYYYQHYMNLYVPLIPKFDINQLLISFAQSPKVSYYMLRKWFDNGTFSDTDPRGWGTNFKKKDRIEPIMVAKNRAYTQEDGLTDFALNSKRINDIINICKSREIKVVIVSMPQTKLYLSYLNQNKLYSILKTCQDFQNNNTNVRYLNLFNDKRFIDEDFYDSDHLNEVGAEKCSKIVNQFLD